MKETKIMCNGNCNQGRNCKCNPTKTITSLDWAGVVILGIIFGLMFGLSI